MDKNEKKPQWMTIGEAARYVGISKDTLRRWEKAGKIESVRSPTNRRYYTQKQLNRIMEGEAPEAAKPAKEKTTKKGLSLFARLLLAAVFSSIAAALIASAIIFGFIK